jgi:hypothetical protein
VFVERAGGPLRSVEDWFMRRVMLIAGLVAVALAGCNADPRPGGARGAKADAARKEAESLARDAVVGAAAEVHARAESRREGGGLMRVDRLVAAAKQAVIAPIVAQSPGKQAAGGVPTASKVPPRETPRFGPRSPIREVVWNQLPARNDAEAMSDLLAVAQDLMERRLAELDPPVRYRPTVNEVKNEFLRHDTRYSSPLGGVTGDDARRQRADEMRKLYEGAFPGNSSEKVESLLYLEYYVEVTADQVRELRTRDRLADGLRIMGLVCAASIAGLMFLRLDQWTRGHLTRLLAVAAALLALAAAIGLYLL